MSIINVVIGRKLMPDEKLKRGDLFYKMIGKEWVHQDIVHSDSDNTPSNYSDFMFTRLEDNNQRMMFEYLKGEQL